MFFSFARIKLRSDLTVVHDATDSHDQFFHFFMRQYIITGLKHIPAVQRIDHSSVIGHLQYTGRSVKKTLPRAVKRIRKKEKDLLTQ